MDIIQKRCCFGECKGRHCSIEALVDELRVVRQSTIMLFESFDPELLKMNCRFFEYEMPLSALGFSITAHQIHHFNVIGERYVSLDG